MNAKVENVNPIPQATTQTNAEQATATQATLASDATASNATNEYSSDNEHFRKVLTEKNNWKERALKAEMDAKQAMERSMREKEDYKALYESKEQEYAQLRERYDAKDRKIRESAKLGALKKELTKLGCDAKYIDKATRLVSMEDVNYDDTTGVVTGVVEVAKMVQEEIPAFFGQTNIGVNQGSPVGTPTNLTLEQWKKLPLDEKKKRREELNQALNLKMR